jgi:hypothetical protein
MLRFAIIVILSLAACTPQTAQNLAPTVIAFPTVTPGRAVSGVLPTLRPASVENIALLETGATPTPNRALCPAPADPQLDPPLRIARDMYNAMLRFLMAGGSPQALDAGLRTSWGVMGANGFVRADFDLTGEGTPEIITSVLSDGGGMLAIFGCVGGGVELLYDVVLGGDAPQILTTDDLNFDGSPELQFASRACLNGEDDCEYRTQVVVWRPSLGRIVNLLGEPIISSEPPRVEDVDADSVSELIIRFDNDGDARTGPLRTGIGVYDWNGAGYVRALTQLDPPRFRIQVVHLADDAFRAEAYDEAAALYQLVLDDTSLDNWQNDDDRVLPPYAAYRLLLAYSALEDARAGELIVVLQTQFPDPLNAPVYVQLATGFWNALQVTNNLRSACAEVQAIMATRPEAVDLLNRYGREGRIYAASDICPF